MTTEWWSYSPRDFLMFSSDIYFGLFERENQRWWPLSLAMSAGGALGVFASALGRPRHCRAALVLFAAAWLLCAREYFCALYATVHTFAQPIAACFVAQAAALLFQAARPDITATARGLDRALGTALAAGAILLVPLGQVVVGKPLKQTESFGLMPDPTVLASIGLLMLMRPVHAVLYLVPFAWSAYSLMTLWSLGVSTTIPFVAVAAIFVRLEWEIARRLRAGRVH